MELDKGYLIAFEGIDGTGKSTHCRLLGEYLKKNGFPVINLREPTQGKWGKEIRKILTDGRGGTSPEEELQLFVNDRKEDVELNINPALAEGKIVLIDRYYFSTAAYQGALGLDPESICRENESFAPRPDLTFIFVAKPENCLKRIEKSRGGFSSFEKLGYLEKVQKIFDSLSGPDICRIDSEPEMDAVQAQVIKQFESFISKKTNR